ncbi:MAG: rod shape-determining protein MreC [Deltaproteobacteria bacterium]|nr:rod shape-determining protein MreC [Deltaproteobacteria bacterium]
MKGFFRRYRPLLTGLLVFILFLELLSLGLKKPGEPDFVSKFVIKMGVSAASIFHQAAEAIQNFGKNYIFLTHLRSENEGLRKEVAHLQGEKTALLEALLENERLKGLLYLRQSFPSPSVTARVIASDPSTWSNTLWIDQGKEDGLRENLPVIAANGIIGRTWRIEGKRCQVLLISHPFSAVDGMIQRTRAPGIAVGTSGKLLEVKYVSYNADIQPGDVLLTTGLEGIFPKGMRIGLIEDVSKEESGLFQEVILRPSVALDQLEEVLILLKE